MIYDRYWADAMHMTSYVQPRLNLAFRALRAEGYIARQRFLCCQSCASTALGTYVERMNPERASKVQGAAFYHKQDAKALESTYFESMEIRYGVIEVYADGATTFYGESNTAVGRRVAQALRDQDLCVEWNGKPDRTITVTGLTQAIVDIAAATERLSGEWREILLPPGGINNKRRASGK